MKDLSIVTVAAIIGAFILAVAALAARSSEHDTIVPIFLLGGFVMAGLVTAAIRSKDRAVGP